MKKNIKQYWKKYKEVSGSLLRVAKQITCMIFFIPIKILYQCLMRLQENGS